MRAPRQTLESDCAAACLAYVAGHHGLSLPLSLARRLSGTTRAGTTALGIVTAARDLGLTAKGMRGGPGFLDDCPKPSIAHVRTASGRNHYLSVLKCDGRRVLVMDPAEGRRVWHDRDAFLAIWTGVMIVLAPGGGMAGDKRAGPPLWRLVVMVWSHRGAAGQLLLGALILSALGLAMSFYVQRIVDDVIPAANGSLLTLLGVGMSVLILARSVLGWLQTVCSLRLAQRIDATLVLAYYRHLLRLPQQFFDSMRVGEMTSRVSDVIQIRSFLSSVTVGLVLNPVVLVVSFGAMFFYSSRLAWVSLTQVPLQGAIWFWTNRLNRKYQRAIKERAADLNSHVTESLHAASTAKRFLMEDALAARTEARFVRLLRTGWRAGVAGSWCSAASAMGSQFYSLLLLWYGTRLALEAAITPGQLMSSYTLAMYVAGSLASLVGLSSDFQQAVIAADRLFEVMDEEPESEGGTVILSPGLVGPIVLQGVTVRHPGRLPALRDVNLAFPKGSITVISGESGSGKSTLLSVLQRLHRPESGRITIGRIDLDYFSTASLRTAISALPQRIELFSGTVLSNIAAGEPAPDMVRVTDLCGDLGILEFIASLPQKFDTHLAERGAGLSGGQRQRLALARTFYRQAPIVLLDEPTMGLDRPSIGKLADMIRRLKAGGTTFIIATHSRSLTGLADQRIALDNGRIVSSTPAGEEAARGAPFPGSREESESEASAPGARGG